MTFYLVNLVGYTKEFPWQQKKWMNEKVDQELDENPDSLNYRKFTKMTLAEFPHFCLLLTVSNSLQFTTTHNVYPPRDKFTFKRLKVIKIQLLKRRLIVASSASPEGVPLQILLPTDWVVI